MLSFCWFTLTISLTVLVRVPVPLAYLEKLERYVYIAQAPYHLLKNKEVCFKKPYINVNPRSTHIELQLTLT